MNFKKLKVKHNNLTFKTEEDLPGVGWYVYRFDELGNCTHDYLQDDLEMAIKCAEAQFGVPPEKWKL